MQGPFGELLAGRTSPIGTRETLRGADKVADTTFFALALTLSLTLSP